MRIEEREHPKEVHITFSNESNTAVTPKMQNCGNPSKIMIDPEVIKTLCGGNFPKDPDGFSFDRIDHFRVGAGGILTGYNYNQPVGPDMQLVLIPSTI